MVKRRSRGDGGLHWDDQRQRWIATIHLGYDGRGKRLVKRTSGKTKTEAKDKLKEITRDLDDGLALAPSRPRRPFQAGRDASHCRDDRCEPCEHPTLPSTRPP